MLNLERLMTDARVGMRLLKIPAADAEALVQWYLVTGQDGALRIMWDQALIIDRLTAPGHTARQIPLMPFMTLQVKRERAITTLLDTIRRRPHGMHRV